MKELNNLTKVIEETRQDLDTVWTMAMSIKSTFEGKKREQISSWLALLFLLSSRWTFSTTVIWKTPIHSPKHCNHTGYKCIQLQVAQFRKHWASLKLHTAICFCRESPDRCAARIPAQAWQRRGQVLAAPADAGQVRACHRFPTAPFPPAPAPACHLPGGHRSTLKAVGSSPTYAMQTPLPTLMLLPAHKELFPHTVGPIELRSKRTLWPTQTWQENVSWYQKYLFSLLYNKLSLAFSKLSVCLIFWESFITLTTNNYVSLPAILFRMA